MRLKKIRLENIRSYKFQELDIPEGSVLLWGNIGSGKSTVLLGVDFALFGLQKGNLTGSSLLRNGEERGTVELFFEVDGKDYVIKRGLKRGKTGVAQDFGFIIKNGVKEEKTALELKQKVLEILDYPKNLLTKNKALIFRYTVYTPQEEMKLILLGSKEERLDALRKVFGIDKYKRIKENCKTVISKIKTNKKEKEGYVSDLDTKLVERISKDEEIKKEEVKLIEINSTFEESKKKVEEKKNDIKFVEEKKEELNKLRKEFELNKLNFTHKRDEIGKNFAKVCTFEEQKAPDMNIMFSKEKVEELEKKKEELEKELRTVLDKIQGFKTKKSIAEELKNKISDLNKCPTCLQEVQEMHKSKIIEDEDNRIIAIGSIMGTFEKKKEDFENQIKELKENLEKEKSKESEYRLQKLKLEQFKEKEKEILELKEKNIKLEQEAKELGMKNDEISNKLNEIKIDDNFYNKLKEEFNTLEQDFRKKELEKKEIEVKIRMIKENLESLDNEIRKKQDVKEKLEYMNKVQFWLENYFVNLMENMEKNVMFKVHEDFNSLFEKWFNILVGNENLDMTLDEEFSPKIFQNGYDMEYEYLSGGEKTAGALAYRLSLNQVINNLMSSIKTNDLIILDEPTDGFSSEQLDRMKLLMEEINIGQILIVSHEAKVESFVDNIIKFEKNEHVTNVVA